MSQERARRVAELAQERVRLLERLAEIDRELLGGVAPDPTPARLSPAVAGSVGVGEQRADLPALVAQIAAEQHKPLTLADLVALVRQAGYRTEAKDFPYMVYQAARKLVERGVLRRHTEHTVAFCVHTAASP